MFYRLRYTPRVYPRNLPQGDPGVIEELKLPTLYQNKLSGKGRS